MARAQTFVGRGKALAHRTMADSDLLFAEMFISLGLLLWGLRILDPSSATFASVDSFRPFLMGAVGHAAVVVEMTWGCIISAVPVVHLVSRIQGWSRVRRWCVFTEVVIWTFIATGLAIGNIEGTGWILCLWFAIGAGWVYIRLGLRRMHDKRTTP